VAGAACGDWLAAKRPQFKTSSVHAPPTGAHRSERRSGWNGERGNHKSLQVGLTDGTMTCPAGNARFLQALKFMPIREHPP